MTAFDATPPIFQRWWKPKREVAATAAFRNHAAPFMPQECSTFQRAAVWGASTI